MQIFLKKRGNVWEYNIPELDVSVSGESDSSNRAIMAAGIEALRATSGVRQLITNNQYVVDACNRWRLGWEAKGFSKVKNTDLLLPLYELLDFDDLTTIEHRS